MDKVVFLTFCLAGMVFLSVDSAPAADISSTDKTEASHDPATVPESTIIDAGAVQTPQSGASSDVMTLPDDVIIDALFSNIDAVQDQLEMCEEGLRQKLYSLKRGGLMKSGIFEDTDEDGKDSDEGDDEDNKEKEEDSFENEDNEDNDGDDDEEEEQEEEEAEEDDEEEDDDDDAEDEEKTLQERVRRRRSASSVASPAIRSASKQKVKNLAQSVVSRLNSRLDYLKQSLVQCYVLYKNLD